MPIQTTTFAQAVDTIDDTTQKILQFLTGTPAGGTPPSGPTGITVNFPTGEMTLTSLAATGNGLVAPGAASVTFLPSSTYTGTINGISYPGTDWQVVPFAATPGKGLPAIPYTVSAGTLNINILV